MEQDAGTAGIQVAPTAGALVAYQNPWDVKAPRSMIRHLRVLYNGGPQPDYDEDPPEGGYDPMAGWSIAEYEWGDDDNWVLGYRWNGRGGIGTPQTRGIPVWIVIAEPLRDVIRARIAELVAQGYGKHPVVGG